MPGENELESLLEAFESGELPEEDSERFQAAIDEFYSTKEERRRRAENEAYQTELADTLMGNDPSWVELSHDGIDVIDSEMAEMEALFGGETEFDWCEPVVGADGNVHMEETGHPNIRQFYGDLYGDELTFMFGDEDARRGILVNHRERERPYEMYTCYPKFIETVAEETSFIYTGLFWEPPNGFYRAILSMLDSVGAFAVDLDRSVDKTGSYFQAGWVMRTLLETFDEHPDIRPNYLCLSGTGIHLWYVFGEQIPLYRAKDKTMPDGTVKRASPRRARYAQVSAALSRWFRDELPPNRFKVDVQCHNINHAFRAPGSPSKDGYPTRMFVHGGKNREKADPAALSAFLGCPLRPYEVGEYDAEGYRRYRAEHPAEFGDVPASERQLETLRDLEEQGLVDAADAEEAATVGEAGRLIRAGLEKRRAGSAGARRVPRQPGARWMKPRAPGLYLHTLGRIRKHTPPGRREQALFALAGIGFLCNIPKEDVRADMESLLGTDWAERKGNDGKPFSGGDVDAAMRGYNARNAAMSRETREDFLGWKYGRPAKRNHRKQDEHLERARRIEAGDYPDGSWRYHGGAPTKQSQVLEWRAAHPDGCKSQCARDTGMSRVTVTKWWDTAIREEEQAEEERR